MNNKCTEPVPRYVETGTKFEIILLIIDISNTQHFLLDIRNSTYQQQVGMLSKDVVLAVQLSLLSELSHLIGQHSAVQLRPPPYI